MFHSVPNLFESSLYIKEWFMFYLFPKKEFQMAYWQKGLLNKTNTLWIRRENKVEKNQGSNNANYDNICLGILAAKCDNCHQFCYFHYQNEKEISRE